MANEHLGLFDTPPSRRETRLAMALVGLQLVAFFALLPACDVYVGEIAAFVPVVDAVQSVGELFIASLLYAQAAVFRSRALKLLASGFVCISLLLVGHALTFPGAFAPDGLFGSGANNAAWIMICRRLGFPLIVILYALLKETDPSALREPQSFPPRFAIWVAGAVTLAGGLCVLAILAGDRLPLIFVDRSQASRANLLVFNLVNLAAIVVAMAVLFTRQRSVLDMWLQVALIGWFTQSLLNLPLHARFTVGWYGLFLFMLLAHLFVLLALMIESSRLYARLALSTAARDREREARMTSMEAVAAAISHEVGQPLAAVTLSARASLNSLTRAQPDLDKAVEALRASIAAGRRTFEVVRSLRATFRNDADALNEFSLNDLVRETMSLVSRELAAHKISVHLALDEDLPPIRANRVQIQRVLVNLLTNAIEALDTVPSQNRRILVRSTIPDAEHVLLEVGDTGAGIPPEQMTRIFDAFFTTKATGTGLGLSLSRTILEEHRGRLWASNRDEQGAVFYVELPASISRPARQVA